MNRNDFVCLKPRQLKQRDLLGFWFPLASTWLMMAIEGPFLAAVIARLAEPKFNLAAYGVAYAFAILVEAPVIMMMSASTALAEDRDSLDKLRRFTYGLNAGISLCMLLLLVPGVFELVARRAISLPGAVADLTYGALWILLPWPAAIGYRRFYQGVLIRQHRTRRVAYGTVIRLCGMASTAALLAVTTSMPGAWVGASALSMGVCLEALASRRMAISSVREIEASPRTSSLDYGRILSFYYPLALTSMLGLAMHPLVTFFMGHARHPIESLAVLPVINALSFIFRSLGLSYQEVVIARVGRGGEHYPEVRNFGIGLGLVASAGLAIIAFTPLSHLWFRDLSGLSVELTGFAITPTRILALLPAFSVLLSLQRGLLVQSRVTGPITMATVIEVLGLALSLFLLITLWNPAGATAAAMAFVLGRWGSNAYLLPACRRVVKRYHSDPATAVRSVSSD